MMRIKINMILALLAGITQLHAGTKYGNYTDAKIGDFNNQKIEALLYYPDREWLYDFDTSEPLTGIESASGTIVSSTDFYMSGSESMKWSAQPGASITFNAGVTIKKVYRNNYTLSLGLFQKDVPTGNDKRAFKIECLSSSNSVLHTFNIYLHKGGWNIISSEMTVNSNQLISKVKLTQTAGKAGDVYLDNFMIFVSYLGYEGVQTKGIEDKNLHMDKQVNYPTTPLTNEEKEAFYTIAERVIPLPAKVTAISSADMDKYRNFHASYNIEVNGEYANGLNPLYYFMNLEHIGSLAKVLAYEKNQDLCKLMEKMGRAWYQTQNTEQKEELGKIISDLVRLVVTYGGTPNPWYNGRGFADGVYYAKELLEEEGLLDQVTSLLIQQYSVDRILFNEQKWENPLAQTSALKGPEFFWQATADHLNTTGKSMMLSLLVAADTPEKARNLRRLKSWMDNIALTYSPNTRGTLKPDGSWFHHWGNRWDNYGWVAGWRGATEFVWYMSHTPFQLNLETMERMHQMADVHFKVMDQGGYAGPQDAMMYVPAEGFMNLAMAGSVDGSSEIDSTMASYWLAYPNSRSYKNNSSKVSAVKKHDVKAAKKPDFNHTLSYDISNIHRRGDWQVYTRGISSSNYHTQYERDGFLFYNIGGVSLCKDGEASGMQNKYGAEILLRNASDAKYITAGYNINRALAVTSVKSDYEKLRQIYYQKGSSEFVGGLSTNNSNGVFVQEFDAKKNSTYSGKVASGLRFKKSYFYFGDNIVMLASDISNNGSANDVETGLVQEAFTSSRNIFELSDGTKTTASEYDMSISSDNTPWLFNSTHKVGAYLFPNQHFQLFKGEQTFGSSKGNIISTYITHNEQSSNAWYAFILSLNSTSDKMKSLENSMQGANPKYKILQQDSKAHIVQSSSDNTTGYAIFNTKGWVGNNNVVRSISSQCVVMVQELPSEAELVLTVSNPDKKFKKTSANPMGWSLPTEIEIIVSGQYKMMSENSEILSLNADKFKNSTKIKVKVKDGLPLEINLRQDRKKNSLPWIETFSMPNETTIDTGMSSWIMNAFDAQAVGFAHVKDNDFWMSGINCNLKSGVIDISETNNAELKVSLRCDQPKRINKNDSVTVFIKVDDGNRRLLWSLVDDFEDTTFAYSGITGDSLQLFIEGCSDRNYAAFIVEDIMVTEVNSTGFGLSKPNHSISVYPNPFNNTFTIKSDYEIHNVQLYTMEGTAIESREGINDCTLFFNPKTQLALGNYLLKVSGEKKSNVLKLCRRN